MSQAYLSRPNRTPFAYEPRFHSVFCDFVDIADDNELYSEPDIAQHRKVSAACPKRIAFPSLPKASLDP